MAILTNHGIIDFQFDFIQCIVLESLIVNIVAQKPQGRIQKVGWGETKWVFLFFGQSQMHLNKFFFLIPKKKKMEDLGVGQGHPQSPQTHL
jgi:hypothetical protein